MRQLGYEYAIIMYCKLFRWHTRLRTLSVLSDMSVTFKERNALGLPQRACDHSSSSFALESQPIHGPHRRSPPYPQHMCGPAAPLFRLAFHLRLSFHLVRQAYPLCWSFPTSSSISLLPPGHHSTQLLSCMDRELRMPLASLWRPSLRQSFAYLGRLCWTSRGWNFYPFLCNPSPLKRTKVECHAVVEPG